MQAIKKDRKPISYITNYCRVNERVYRFLKDKVKNHNKETQHIFFHLYASCSLPQNLKEGKSIPLPYETIAKFLDKGKRGFVHLDKLIEDGLIEKTKEHSIQLEQCSEYRVTLDIQKQLISLYSFEEDNKRVQFYNLINDKKINISDCSKLTYGVNNDKLPDLVYSAIKGFKVCFINHKKVKEYLAEAELNSVNDQQLLKFFNDKRCYESVTSHWSFKITDDELAYYIPSYEAQMSGRVSELEGRLQSCSRAMKNAAFTFPDCYNYDLKSSQVYFLKWWFEKANISTDWLDEFLKVDKSQWAEQIGISRKCLKNCIYAIFMGAELPYPLSKYWDKEAGKYKEFAFTLSVGEYLIKEAKRVNRNNSIDFTEIDKELAQIFLNKLNDLLSPLKKQLKLFYEWLLYTYCEKEQYRGTVKNLTGMIFDLKAYAKSSNGKYRNQAELSRKITAFFLQGTEAAFIHYLSREEIQIKYNYQAINNAHDGLVTIGIISEGAILEAKRFLNLPYAWLEEKEVCSSEEQKWWDIK